VSTTDRPRLRRFLAAALSATLAATGAVALTALPALPAAAAYPESVNPFAIAGGFTVYAREDALLQNQETEGSIAVGGTATVQGSSGTYSIIHVSAGTGAYDLPTVDGDPTRFLVGRYSTASTGILAITSAGTTDPALYGDLKMVQRDGPWQPFARADWIRLNQNPSNPDQTPLIDSTHQQYPASAAPPSGSTGGGSIYTANTSSTAVADYVEANRQASWAEASACFADIADPTAGIGYPVTVAEHAGDRVVLGPLSADMPNVLDYADLGGATLIQFSSGSPTPGVTNPLVIRVPAGTTTVTGARIDPQGQYAPYVVWDLSQLTGDVEVTAGQARMDGSIYAPDASVTVTAAPLDGQVIAQNVTIKGGEVHSYLFSSEIPCNADSGTFAVRKELSGIDDSALPVGTTFTVNYRAVPPEGEAIVGTLEVPADGTPVAVGTQFPIGTVVTFEEIEPETVPGWEWGDATIVPNPLTIGAGTADVVVTNTATEITGTFSITKSIDFLGGDPVDVPAGATVPVHWTAWDGTTQIDEGTLFVPLDGTVVDVGRQFPVGTRIVLTEDLSGVIPPDGYEWSSVGWDPGRTFVIEDGSTVAVELTNAVTPADAERTITIVKAATGDAADPAYGYAVSYNTDPAGTRTTMDLPVGDPQPIDAVETDADTLELAELVPTLDGAPTDASDWELPVITVTVDDGEPVTYRPTAFDEGQPDLTGAIADIPLPETGDISIEVTNVLREGTFELSKAFQGVPPDQIPPGLEFTVAWTATLPTGEVRTGILRLPGDGTAVGPLDDDGAPMLFPYGTVITYTELTPPAVPHLSWLGAQFQLDQLVIGQDDQAVVRSTLTNDVSVLRGTFLVQKDLSGIDADQLLTDAFTIDYVAHEPDLTVTAGRFTLPADGTPAGPVDGSGNTITFPIGTTIWLIEEEPDAAALPPGYEWSGTTWNPGSSVVIGLGDTPVLEVTNSVVAMTRWAVTKVVEGGGAGSIPAGTTFPVDWWLDGEQQPRVALEPNVTQYSPYFPVSTIIEVREVDPAPVPGVDWGTPTWSVDGQTLTPGADGHVTLPMSQTASPATAELTLTNTASAHPLPATGGGGLSPLIPLGALTAIALGAFLTIRRTRSAREL